ncbi:hypothetical protein K490DRAFT_53700 [Saccharata proteae CBS 121410]|uniref:Uncharacterized protein n=1 Tax=Saccharata proteae CBS 121410 TaxID=1314787 RepID=A0A9P4I1B8_9PEZI|nr:hypothetical protein K490DRAFT_53700 [Saccharata proteae CBS 121410]
MLAYRCTAGLTGGPPPRRGRTGAGTGYMSFTPRIRRLTGAAMGLQAAIVRGWIACGPTQVRHGVEVRLPSRVSQRNKREAGRQKTDSVRECERDGYRRLRHWTGRSLPPLVAEKAGYSDLTAGAMMQQVGGLSGTKHSRPIVVGAEEWVGELCHHPPLVFFNHPTVKLVKDSSNSSRASWRAGRRLHDYANMTNSALKRLVRL